MNPIAEEKVASALDLAIDTALMNAKLPRLTDREHAGLLSVQMVAIILNIDHVIKRAQALFEADRRTL